MQIPVQTFSAMLEQMAAGVQGAAAQLLDFSVGSVLRALMEACAGVALWLQWMILQVLSATRAATSQGPDLDSWMADFALTRLPASTAAGTVTFARYTAGVLSTIPVGTTVLTLDASEGFVVAAVPGNPAWNGSTGYNLAPSLLSVAVPVAAAVAGSNGNILAGAIGLIAAPIAGVDTVTNSVGFAGGADAESDAALRIRFQLYINSRSLATGGAVAFAITSVQQGLRYAIVENQSPQGQPQPGNFCVVVDDGSGYPSLGLLTLVQANVDAVRPIGSTYSVTGPNTTEVTVVVTLETASSLTHAAVAAKAQAAILAWLAGLPVGGTLAISKIDAISHGVDASVLSVTSTLINGAAMDVVAPANGVLLPASVTVS
jgi:uncharacterized phage protein gp47/JayE